MTFDQIVGMLERDVRGIIQQMLCNNQINVAQHNYVLNEWNMNRNHLANLAMNKYYGNINPQQSNAIAMGFINTAMGNFQRTGGRPTTGGMMQPQMNPMGGMMYGNPMFGGQPDPYGGMYGNSQPNGYTQQGARAF